MVASKSRLGAAVAAASALTIVLALPGAASGAITIGETFTPPILDCAPNYTRLQSSSAEDAYVVPTAGVITSWSFRADEDPPTTRFKVGRSAGGDDFTIVGQSALVTPPANELSTYPASIAVEAGDVIGSYTQTGGGCADFSPDPGYEGHNFDADVLPGVTELFASEPIQLDISAVVEPNKQCGGKSPTSVGTAGSDALIGTPGNDVFLGLGGKDTIKGKGGADVACGGNGKDKLKGGADNDKLKGQKGNDAMKGAAGEDKCVGGKGKDTAKKCEVTKSL
jgi:RTX calcium-binding nonapeptide repeat (4 copies)